MRVFTHLSVQSFTEFLRNVDRTNAAARLRRPDGTAAIRALSDQDAVGEYVDATQPASLAETYPCPDQKQKKHVVDLPGVADALVEAVTELARAMEEFGDLTRMWNVYRSYSTGCTSHAHITAWMGFKMVEIDSVLYDALQSSKYLMDSASGKAAGYKIIPKGAEVVLCEPRDGPVPERVHNIIMDVPTIVFDGVILKGLRTVATFTASGEPVLCYVADKWAR